MKKMNNQSNHQDNWERNMWYYLLAVLVPAALVLLWLLWRKGEEEEPEKTIQEKASDTLSPEPLSPKEITIDEKRPGEESSAEVIAQSAAPEKARSRRVKKEQEAPVQEAPARKSTRTSRPRQKAAPVETPASKAPTQAEVQEPIIDDFTRIQGIGPRINNLFHEQGILTYRQLADEDPIRLKDILVDASLFGANPTTWPQQAALANAGDWDALEELKSKTKGSRS
jgi:predicted flap endonuclease-1-like 5' DNA nuclease